ncbi:GNAT family N-acetyltransferase [bacterium]|nr:GNAT family N-acetyltransferase [bacterium]
MDIEDISLHDVTENDIPLLYRWFNDENTYGEFDEPNQVSEQQIREKFIKGGFKSDDRGTLIIFNGENPIGFFNFLRDPIDTWIMYEGTVIAIENMRNRGIGTIVHQLGARYIFNHYQTIQKIEGVTDKNHLAARRCAEKAGFTFEGILRWRNKRKGEFCDMAYYGILRSEIEGG